jgi:hypothetical protein
MSWLSPVRRANARWLIMLFAPITLACDAARVLTPYAAREASTSMGTALTCTGDRSSGTPVLSCSSAPSAASGRMRARDVTLGQQNLDVTLTATSTTYSADTFAVNITIKNLLAQPIGTPDGTTNTKVRVFISTGPSVSAGSGSVTVVPDSVGTFTSSGQAYYIYNQIIQPQATSLSRAWKFVLPPSVTQFQFAAYVTAKVPSQQGVLLWNALRPAGISSQSYEAIWANTPSDIYAAGQNSTVAHYNGSAWSLLTSPGLGNLQGIYGFPTDSVWVVGAAGGRALWNGTAWTTFSAPAFSGSLNAVWGSSSTDVYAVGDSGKIMHFTGGAWTVEAPPALFTSSLKGVWGTSDGTTVFAVAAGGAILRRVAGIWLSAPSPATQDLLAIWGTGTTFYTVGVSGSIYTTTGLGWSTMTTPVVNTLRSIRGTSTTDIYADGDNGTVIHYNGTTWSIVPTPFVQTLFGISDGGAGGTTWAVGLNGTLFSYNGTSWSLDPASGMSIYSIYASGPSDIWAAGQTGVVLHYNGSSWALSGAGVPITAVWGTSSSNVYGVGGGGGYSIYNGTKWTSGNLGTSSSFYHVWGTAANNVYVVGDLGLVYRYNGATWSKMTQSATTNTLNGIWGTDSNNVFAAGNLGTIVRYQAGAWTAMTSGNTATLNSVFGAGLTHVYVVGNGGTTLSYANVGTSWTTQALASQNLFRIWAADSADVYAVGNAGVVWAYNGSVWYALSTGVTSNLRSVFGTSATNVYIGGDLGLIMVGGP